MKIIRHFWIVRVAYRSILACTGVILLLSPDVSTVLSLLVLASGLVWALLVWCFAGRVCRCINHRANELVVIRNLLHQNVEAVKHCCEREFREALGVLLERFGADAAWPYLDDGLNLSLKASHRAPGPMAVRKRGKPVNLATYVYSTGQAVCSSNLDPKRQVPFFP